MESASKTLDNAENVCMLKDSVTHTILMQEFSTL